MPAGLAVALLTSGAATSLAAGEYTRAVEHRSAQAVLDHRAAVAGWALGLQAQRYQDAVAAVAAGAGAQQDMSAADFAALVQPLAGATLPGVSGAAFVVPADDADAAAASTFWQARGGAPLRPGAGAGEHLLAVYTTALGEDAAPLPAGQDLSGLAPVVSALDEARRSDRATASDAFVLLKDRTLPRADQQQAVVLAAPVHSPGDPVALRGWVLVTARVGDLATATLDDASQGLINVSLTVPTVGGGGSVVGASVRTGADDTTTTPQRLPVLVAGHRWTLEVAGTAKAERLRGGYVDLGRVLELGGGALSALLAVLAWVLASDRDRARARVLTATAGLRAAEAAARDQARLLDAVVSSIGDGVGVVNSRGEFLLHNRAARALLGVGADLDDPGGWQAHYGLFLPDGVTPFPTGEMPLVRALAGEATDNVDMLVRRPDRAEPIAITVTGRPLDEAAGVPGGGAVAVFHDVSEARRLTARLAARQQEQQRLLAALSDLGEGVCVSEDGRVVWANEAYLRMTGYTLREVRQRPAAALAADEETARQFLRYATLLSAPGATTGIMTARLRHRDGHPVPVEVSGVSVDREGTVQRIGLVRDLSERVRTAEQLAERARALESANAELARARDAATAASQAKSTFVARMSHEIRTPLNGVVGLTGLLCESGLTDAQRAMAETAARSGQALAGIVDDILDFAKIEAGKVEVEVLPLDLAELLDDIAVTFAAQASAEGLDLLVDCPPASVVTDPTRVRQVLSNLVGNAVKFTEAGSITLRARPLPAGLRIEVTDTGPGIPAHDLSRLFDAFEQAGASTTRRYGGTGLGLTISRHLAEVLGGTLTCRSTPGAGATFTLTLPGVDVTAAPPAGGGERPLAGRRVLLLAATAPLRAHLQGQLRALGAVVVAPAGPPSLPDAGRVDAGRVDAAVLDTRHPDHAAVLAGLAGTTRGTGAVALAVPVVVLHPLGRPPAQLPPGAEALGLPVRATALRTALTRAPRPAVPAASAGPVGAPAAPEGATRRLRVLVADDNETNRLVAALVLQRLGHDADVVADGREAVEAARLTRYDAVLMDCQMPVLDGLGATRALRALPVTAAVPIIALTAGASPADEAACRAAGMDAWLTKPVRSQDLDQALRSLVGPAPGWSGGAVPVAPAQQPQNGPGAALAT